MPRAAALCVLIVGALCVREAAAASDGDGLTGDYPMGRDGSGTSWVPDVSPMDALHGSLGDWTTMAHGSLVLADTRQGGPRGGSATYSESLFMGAARRALDDSAVTVRAMLSADPVNGAAGYPLLLQTGETADGHTPLVDRQHPHNLVMELALTYTRALNGLASWFVYAAPVGEPALGPPAFLHRRSSDANPEAPLGHHHLDATHVSFGVVTTGLVAGRWKWDVSAFNGREPDQHRSAIELRGLDSVATRLSFNPTPSLALQVSTARLASPESLNPGVGQTRHTASVLHEATWGGITASTTLAFGRNRPSVGPVTDAWLWDEALRLGGGTTLYGRVERVGSDEWPVAAGTEGVPTATKQSLGLQTEVATLGPVRLAVGAVGSRYDLPAALRAVYGSSPDGWTVYVRGRLAP